MNTQLEQLLREETERRLLVEQNLSVRLKQQEAIAWFGEYAVSCKDLNLLLNQAARLTADTLEVEFCKVLELLPGGDALSLVAGVGWHDGLVGAATVGSGMDSQAGYTLYSDEPVIVRDLRSETRFSGPQLLLDHQVISGISAIIRGTERPFGVIGAHSTQNREFTAHDTHFLQTVANILASAIERSRAEDELRRSRKELETILNGISEGITVQELDGRLSYANQEAARLAGYSGGKEMLETPLNELRQKFELFDEDGNPFPAEQLPGRMVLNGAPRASATIRFRVKDTGDEHRSLVEAAPIYDHKGKVIQAVNIFRDVTELFNRARSQQLLSDAGELLASSLEYQTTLTNLADLLVAHFADWCTVHLMPAPDEVVQIAVAHRDHSRKQLALEAQKKYPPDYHSDRGVARVLRTGQAEYFPVITPEMIRASARSEEHLRLLTELKMRAAMLVPLNARGRTLGAISLIWAESGRTFTDDDIVLVTELARRAAIAIDNARLYQEAQQVNAALEQRVTTRTQQLERSNRQLIKEVEERRKAESALRKSEALLNQLFESAPDATILADRSGKIVRVNHQVESIFGYHRDELVGETIEKLLPRRLREIHVRHRDGYLQQIEAASNDPATEQPKLSGAHGVRPMGSGLELAGVRKDGNEFPIDVMLSPVRTDEGELIISAVRDVTERKRLETELAEMHRQLFDSIEAERLTLSQELHDGPIQEMYALALYLETLRGALNNPQDEENLLQTKETLQSVVQMLREICGELRPPVLEQFGLGKAIRSHLLKLQESHPDLKVNAVLMQDGPWMSDRTRLALYRIYQNAISNILRHAEAKNIQITFQVADGAIVLTVEDDGRGFRVPKKWVELARGNHFGLVGIVERVQALNGELQVESAPGKGTRILVRLPFDTVE